MAKDERKRMINNPKKGVAAEWAAAGVAMIP
jgi:hypothetical protein